MHKRNSIVNLPLLVGLVLSIALHVAALYSKKLRATPAQPQLETGQTVVQLTLLPSRPSPAAAQPIPESVPQASSLPDPVPTPQAALLPDPIPKQPPVQSPKPQVAAPEQNASVQEDKGVLIDALPREGIRPTYPRRSQRRGEEGTVVLSIEVFASGRPGKVEVVQSSGHRPLDEAAVKAAKKTSYTPAQQFGHPVDSTLIQPLTFELTTHD